MFAKLLIANRGEIACRVIRTARRLGVRTVAVHSDADANAPHVLMADEAVRIGPAPARESYLAIDAVLEAATRTRAAAIHPGYGFLSENAGFAEACAAAGIVFVGPPAAAIRAMGDKAAAKAMMEKSGVAVVPGYHGAAQDLPMLALQARRIGYPVLIKATAGGGGKGMRIVTGEYELAPAIEGAKREAAAAFGDDRILIERYLERPRHIEVQVFCDSHGGAVHLFERDCSVQRRHQKVVEEAPAPGIAGDRRLRLGEAAVRAARAVGYVGAGTVEFIMAADGTFFFLEMNTRLQVEHPVTEMITGTDLVEWQLRVAAGERLPAMQGELEPRGHAVEVRLYAEDPAKDYLPQTGRLAHLRFPAEDGYVRVDAGVAAGDAISIHYDPMIAKLIAWDETRERALARLARALDEVEVAGLPTNRDLLRRILRHENFRAGAVDTGFLARHREALVPPPEAAPGRALALAVVHLLLARVAEANAAAAASADPWSPWAEARGWRLNDDAFHVLRLRDGDAERAVTAHFRSWGFIVDLPDGPCEVTARLAADGGLEAAIDGHRLRARVVATGGELVVFLDGEAWRLAVVDPIAEAAAHAPDPARLAAPMPGKVVAIKVAAGDAVKRGQALVVLEAMKMEHTVHAPADGVVDALRCAVGEQVEEGVDLVGFTAGETPP